MSDPYHNSNKSRSYSQERSEEHWHPAELFTVFPYDPRITYEDAFDQWIAGNKAAYDARHPPAALAPSSPPSGRTQTPALLLSSSTHHPGSRDGSASNSPRQNQLGDPPGAFTIPPPQNLAGYLQMTAPLPRYNPYDGNYSYSKDPPSAYGVNTLSGYGSALPSAYSGPPPVRFGGAPISAYSNSALPDPTRPSKKAGTPTKKAGTPNKPSTMAKRVSHTPKKVNIRLQMGFAWDRQSLALLCKWKEVRKKGASVMASSGDFPGHTAAMLDAAWGQHKVQGRRFYQEVYNGD